MGTFRTILYCLRLRGRRLENLCHPETWILSGTRGPFLDPCHLHPLLSSGSHHPPMDWVGISRDLRLCCHCFVSDASKIDLIYQNLTRFPAHFSPEIRSYLVNRSFGGSFLIFLLEFGAWAGLTFVLGSSNKCPVNYVPLAIMVRETTCEICQILANFPSFSSESSSPSNSNTKPPWRRTVLKQTPSGDRLGSFPAPFTT